MMAEPRLIQEAFLEANAFLAPVLIRDKNAKSKAKSLLECLDRNHKYSGNGSGSRRAAVIGKALEILSRIHAGFVTPTEQTEQSQHLAAEGEDVALEDAKRRRILHALLDLISLEGIYPSLSIGVGIPLQQRVISVLPAGVIAKQAAAPAGPTPHDLPLLCRIVDVLLDILLDSRSSIQPVVSGRILTDIISGTADLAFNPKISGLESRNDLKQKFDTVLKETPSSTLLPILSSFLQADTADWFKSKISTELSHIPLRPGGVLQTIMFLASQFAPSLGQEARSQPSNGPHFTVKAIMHISKLLSSIPEGLEPSAYITVIAPQLLALLDGEDPDLKKTASYTISNGILGKRTLGAPGTVGHKIFIDPLVRILTANLNDYAMQWIEQDASSEGVGSPSTKPAPFPNTIIGHELINLALERLSTLALQHPNPALVKRIVHPILLPLWGLASYSKQHEIKTIHEKAMTLLQTFFGISVGLPPLKKLVDNLLWDGGASWTYSSSSDASVRLVKRNPEDSTTSNMIRLIDSLQVRAELFTTLLSSDPSVEESTSDIFLYVSQTWLVRPDSEGASQKLDDSESMMRQLTSAKVAEKLLDDFKDTLSRRPLRVLDLIKQVIDGELHRMGGEKGQSPSQKSEAPSLSSLANIVDPKSVEEQDESDKEISESLSVAFSLLSTVLASPDFSHSEDINILLASTKESLDKLIPLLPDSLSKPATTSSMLLEIQLTSPEHDETKPTPPHIVDLETHRRALSNLNSPLPPIQAEGFSLLSKLITNSSPVLDIPSTLTLLISVITDISDSTANDEFIYLNAIKLIGTLASRHPKTVIKTLVDSYVDRSEHRTLDQRLKIGESLLRTVQDLGEALAGETAKILGEGMVTVAGRRGNKPQAQHARKKHQEKERRKQELEERKAQKEAAMPEGWSIPSDSTLPKLEDSDSESESPEKSIHSANVVAAWAAGAASDDEPDDLRVRASALSILASAVTTNLRGLGPTVTASAVELALATLTQEPAAESAIIRRASAVLLLDILKTVDAAREDKGGRALGFGFSLREEGIGSTHEGFHGPSTIGNIPTMLQILGLVEAREEDAIVRGHLRILTESLEVWIEKSLMWAIGGNDGEPRMELGDRIAGLDVDPLAGRGIWRPRIEEIE